MLSSIFDCLLILYRLVVCLFNVRFDAEIDDDHDRIDLFFPFNQPNMYDEL